MDAKICIRNNILCQQKHRSDSNKQNEQTTKQTNRQTKRQTNTDFYGIY